MSYAQGTYLHLTALAAVWPPQKSRHLPGPAKGMPGQPCTLRAGVSVFDLNCAGGRLDTCAPRDSVPKHLAPQRPSGLSARLDAGKELALPCACLQPPATRADTVRYENARPSPGVQSWLLKWEPCQEVLEKSFCQELGYREPSWGSESLALLCYSLAVLPQAGASPSLGPALQILSEVLETDCTVPQQDAGQAFNH